MERVRIDKKKLDFPDQVLPQVCITNKGGTMLQICPDMFGVRDHRNRKVWCAQRRLTYGLAVTEM